MATAPRASSEVAVMSPHDMEAKSGRSISLQVVTPRGSAVARTVDEVTVPGALGELGVLPGHLPLLAAVRPGVLVVRDGGARTYFAVGAGFVQVGAANAVQVLVESAEASTSIDVADARREVDRLTGELRGAGTPDAVQVLTARLAWAQARVDAYERARGKAE